MSIRELQELPFPDAWNQKSGMEFKEDMMCKIFRVLAVIKPSIPPSEVENFQRHAEEILGKFLEKFSKQYDDFHNLVYVYYQDLRVFDLEKEFSEYKTLKSEIMVKKDDYLELANIFERISELNNTFWSATIEALDSLSEQEMFQLKQRIG